MIETVRAFARFQFLVVFYFSSRPADRRMMNAVKLEKYGAPDATIPVVQASLQREDEGGKRGFVMMAGDSAAAIPTDQYDGHPESVIWGIVSVRNVCCTVFHSLS